MWPDCASGPAQLRSQPSAEWRVCTTGTPGGVRCETGVDPVNSGSEGALDPAVRLSVSRSSTERGRIRAAHHGDQAVLDAR